MDNNECKQCSTKSADYAKCTLCLDTDNTGDCNACDTNYYLLYKTI